MHCLAECLERLRSDRWLRHTFIIVACISLHFRLQMFKELGVSLRHDRLLSRRRSLHIVLPLVHGRTIEVTGSDLLPISESLRVAPHIGRVAPQFHLALLLPLLDAIKSIGSCVTFLVITDRNHHV